MSLLSNSFHAINSLNNALHDQMQSSANMEPIEKEKSMVIDVDNEFGFQNDIWSNEQIRQFDEQITRVYNERVKLYGKRRKGRIKLVMQIIALGLFAFLTFIAVLFLVFTSGKGIAFFSVVGSITAVITFFFVLNIKTLNKIKNELKEKRISLDLSSCNSDLAARFEKCVSNWITVFNSDAVYYIMARDGLTRDQKIKQRTTAGQTVTRISVNSKISFFNKFLSNMNYDPFIDTGFEPLVATTRGNGALVIYPGFVVAMYDNKLYEPNMIKVYSWTNLSIRKSITTFIESGPLPPPRDARVVSFTYEHANLDGSMDRRYASNRQIPIVEYGQIFFNNGGTIYEYMISNRLNSENFFESVKKLEN